MNISAILVPVDGSPASLHAVEFAIQLAQGHDGITLHILSVQAPIISGNAKRFISADVVAEYYQDEGNRALDPAKAILDKSGVPYQAHIEIGQIAETIYHFTKEHDCGLVAMGTRGLGSVAGLLMGSITTKVLSLVEVPVTLVK